MALFTVSEKFAGATYAKSIVLEEETIFVTDNETEDAAESVAEEEPEKVEKDVAEDAVDNATEDIAEVFAKSPFEDEEISLTSPDEPVSKPETAEEESSEQLQIIPAVKTVTAKTPEESLYIGTSIEQKPNPFQI